MIRIVKHIKVFKYKGLERLMYGKESKYVHWVFQKFNKKTKEWEIIPIVEKTIKTENNGN